MSYVNPSCPKCGHYNAMLNTYMGDGKYFLQCRDCQYIGDEVVATEKEVVQTKHAPLPQHSLLDSEPTDWQKHHGRQPYLSGFNYWYKITGNKETAINVIKKWNFRSFTTEIWMCDDNTVRVDLTSCSFSNGPDDEGYSPSYEAAIALDATLRKLVLGNIISEWF